MGSWDSNATCWVVDRNHQFYDALTWVDDLDSGTIPFTNIATMVSACQRNTVQFSRAIDYLVVFGHGTSGYQGMGCGTRIDYSGNLAAWYNAIVPPGHSHLIGAAEQMLSRLNGVLTEDATVLFAGCSVGKGEPGDGLLSTVSTILKGRAVQGFENDVYWWTGVMAGSLKTAYGTEVTSEYRIVSLW